MDRYLAHKAKDGREQTVEDHNSAVAELAGHFAAGFDMESEARLAGNHHDDGKRTCGFQKRLLCNGPRVDHATYGAAQAGRASLEASWAIMGHHSGLPDLGSSVNENPYNSTWFGRMHRFRNYEIECPKEPFMPVEAHVLPDLIPTGESVFPFAFRIRMLYSCLVDADFLDTEEFMAGRKCRVYDYDNLEQMSEHLEAYIEKEWGKPKTLTNRRRQMILENARIQGKTLPTVGLYTMTIPTGGGKTGASLRFALAMALRKWDELKKTGKTDIQPKIIYVIPYTSIIEQNAEKFRSMVDEKNVLEHHSNYEGRTGARDEELKLEELASENWDAPLVVTTSVRFFEALYANRPAKCRRLHNLANAVIIFDEAQQIPVEHLLPCTKAIEELVRHYGVTAVLCTATQPALSGMFGDLPVREIQPDCAALYQAMRRTTVKVLPGKPMAVQEIAKMISRRKQALCIVNTRQAAKDVYDALPEKCCKYHLSTLMTSADRRRVIQEVTEQLKNGKPVVLVSTSLIEAGVDMDFPVVFRELTGLDSILQAAGRCNRNGYRRKDRSIVYVFTRDGNTPVMLKHNIQACQAALMEHADDLDSLEAIRMYFEELYRSNGEDSGKEDWKDRDFAYRAFRDGDGPSGRFIPFRTVAERFHFIDGATHTVYIPDKEINPCLDRIREGTASLNDYRQAGLHAVQLMSKAWKSYVDRGIVDPLDEGSGVLVKEDLYHHETGLTLTYGDSDGIFS